MPDDRCETGDWVEVEYVLLEPADRAPGLPEDTAAQPLIAWVKGFATAAATIGDDLTVETITGRVVTGRLTSTKPGYYHTFGDPIPALTHVGRDLRVKLAEARGTGATGRLKAGDAS